MNKKLREMVDPDQDIYEAGTGAVEPRIELPKPKKKPTNTGKNFFKTLRLIQITGLILATLLLARQNFTYSLVLAGFVGLSVAEIVLSLVFNVQLVIKEK